MEKKANTAHKRAWVDDGDEGATNSVPAFLKQSHATPSWAVPDEKRLQEAEAAGEDGSSSDRRVAEALAKKRFRSEDLDSLLARSEPLLSSRHDRSSSAAPTVLSVLPLPRDAGKSVHWHRNGQLVLVGGSRHVYTFHAAGKFVEQINKIDTGSRLDYTCLLESGEEVLCVGHEAYAPQLVNIATETLVPLKFLDTRDTAVHRNGRSDNTKKELFISNVVSRPSDPLGKGVALTCGSTVTLASLASGGITGRITADAPVTDVKFLSSTEIGIASGAKLMIYDVRKTARFVRQVMDESVLDVSCFAVSASSSSVRAMAVGSSSGVVNVYNYNASGAAAVAAPAAPRAPLLLREMRQLVTPISAISFGQNSQGENVMAFATRGQKGGFRLARLPELHVVPSFPAVSTRHGFIQSLTIAPTVPILSVGEKQKVTNYAL